MRSKKIFISVAVFAVMISLGIGAGVFLLKRQAARVEEETPQAQTAQPTLTVQASSNNLTASESGTLDIYLNTFGTKVEGFQFIATVDGTSTPTVQDADTSTPGIQVRTGEVEALSTATNSVVDQNGKQIVRFAMITKEAGQPYMTTVPVKVATITVTPATAGTLQFEFNPQNTRASATGGGDDILIAASDTSYSVTAGTIAAAPVATPQPPTATSSSEIAALTVKKPTVASPSATPKTASSLIAASSSTSSSTLTTSVTSTSSATTSSATATPRATATPIASSSAQDLPVSGSTEQTVILLAGGLLFLGAGLAVQFAMNREE